MITQALFGPGVQYADSADNGTDSVFGDVVQFTEPAAYAT